MANLRYGTYGAYYGSYFDESVALTTAEKEVNAFYIRDYLLAKGWTIEAVCGMLGNMEHESALNPGRWEGNNVGSGPGYGIVQWTPWTKYTGWCENEGRADPSEMDNNLDRIIWELNNGVQYYTTENYPETFAEFSVSTKTPYYLACAFAWNYERSAVVLWGANSKAEADTLTEAEKEANREALRQLRGGSANKWYEFLTGSTPPTPPTPTPTKKSKMPLWMFLDYQ